MSIEVWLYVKPAAWDAIAPGEEAAKDIWHYPYKNAITGFWKPYNVDYEVYNIIGNDASIQAIIDQINPADIAKTFSWIQGPGFDNLYEWPTDPSEVLAVMKDHPDTSPATMENPNWGHVFLGQGERIFAGDFNNDFNGDFF